jgi:hypothetical protein
MIVMLSILKELLHPFGQVLVFGINKASFQLQDLLDLCSKCNETFPKVSILIDI